MLDGNTNNSSSMSEKIKNEIKDTFDLLDGDRDGVITVKDLGEIMKILDSHVKDFDINEVSKEIDDNIDYKSYESLWAMKLNESNIEHDYISIFKYFDKDNNGLIDQQDLVNGFNALGAKITLEEAEEMIIEADLDSDKLIDKEEFCRMMYGVQ
jgi:Ca2+-binding EF-hand superfamily protein